MSKPRRGSGKGRSSISEDDAAVWEHTARSLEPLRKSKPRVHPAIPEDAEDAEDAVFAPRTGPAGRKRPPASDASPESAGAEGPASRRASTPAKTVVPQLQPFDVKRARRLKSGRTEIDARIDLHGMKQAEAHARLRRFLLTCHADGLRTVLVITGKGGRAADTSGDERWTGAPERGVLKRNVPSWLAEPELRRIVVSFTAAAVRHGGDGALYVHLRSAARSGSHD